MTSKEKVALPWDIAEITFDPKNGEVTHEAQADGWYCFNGGTAVYLKKGDYTYIVSKGRIVDDAPDKGLEYEQFPVDTDIEIIDK